MIVRRSRMIATVEAVSAVLLVTAAVVSWRNGVLRTAYTAQGEIPAHDSVRYAGPWLVLAAVLVMVAGLTCVDAAVRTLRTRSLGS